MSFAFEVGAAVKVPPSYLSDMNYDLVGTIAAREPQDEAEPRYLIVWDDETGPHENWWSESSVEPLAGQPEA